jgi:hypothetical protein
MRAPPPPAPRLAVGPDLLGQLLDPVPAQAPDGQAGTAPIGPITQADTPVVVALAGHLRPQGQTGSRSSPPWAAKAQMTNTSS